MCFSGCYTLGKTYGHQTEPNTIAHHTFCVLYIYFYVYSNIVLWHNATRSVDPFNRIVIRGVGTVTFGMRIAAGVNGLRHFDRHVFDTLHCLRVRNMHGAAAAVAFLDNVIDKIEMMCTRNCYIWLLAWCGLLYTYASARVFNV